VYLSPLGGFPGLIRMYEVIIKGTKVYTFDPIKPGRADLKGGVNPY
jgi:hypothetical protein